MGRKTKNLCPHGVFDKVLRLELILQEPRFGCNARTEIITDFLHAKKYVTGRIWILPIERGARFNAPLKDIDGNFLTFPEWSKFNGRLTWPFHVAATALTEKGEILVYDPAAYKGPVPAETWKKPYAHEAVEILTLGLDEPPGYKGLGSCYAPGPQQQYNLDNYALAVLELESIGILYESPLFSPPAYRPADVPRIDDSLLVRDVA